MLKITFVQQDGDAKVVEVHNLGESLMEAARKSGVAGILADCGGACACATCHVYVDPEWTATVGRPNDVEVGVLDLAADVLENSRLSCQIKLRQELDGLRVTVVNKA